MAISAPAAESSVAASAQDRYGRAPVIERIRVMTERRWFHDGVLALIVLNAW